MRGSAILTVFHADQMGEPLWKPTLTTVDKIGSGLASIDQLVREYIRGLSYRFVQTPDGTTALELERIVQAKGLSVGQPVLNPR